jgi:hypothetical protein
MESVLKHRFGLVVLLLLFVVPMIAAAKPAVPSWRDTRPWTTEVATVRIGDQVLQAEIADTGRLQQRGLGYRDGLAPGTGMLFVFDDVRRHTFWMKGMRFCLDIIWIQDEVITGAAESVCPMPDVEDADLPRYSSEVPISHVLEVPAGWMAINGFGPGTPVEITLPDSMMD